VIIGLLPLATPVHGVSRGSNPMINSRGLTHAEEGAAPLVVFPLGGSEGTRTPGGFA
jgi:hypothetical protein